MTTRRGFLRGVLALGAAAVLPSGRPKSATAIMQAHAPTIGDTMTLDDIKRLRATMFGAKVFDQNLYLVVSRNTLAKLRRKRLLGSINGTDYFGGYEVIVQERPA